MEWLGGTYMINGEVVLHASVAAPSITAAMVSRTFLCKVCPPVKKQPITIKPRHLTALTALNFNSTPLTSSIKSGYTGILSKSVYVLQ
jgi:hypothetical protein